MPQAASYRDHLNGAEDLVTTYEQRRAGFVAMALERGRRAVPHIAEARALKVVAENLARPGDLLQLQRIRDALVVAAGVSEKASGHFDDGDKAEAVSRLVREFLEPAGQKWVEELVYRFLLTRGDSLGGELRNLAGVLAQKKLAGALIAALTLTHVGYR